ncbi:MAG: hypothetical protein Q9169_006473 [Polycauliona sp. 2 TL-2023]
MTVNLLLGIIALPAPRTIITRRDARTVSLLELTVGDDTAAGFGINIWLPPEPGPQSFTKVKGKAGLGAAETEFRESVQGLRVRDVVVMRNVALACWRGRVYGQSLRRGVTRVEVVERFGKVEREVDGEVGEKVRRVREWVLGFVGGGDVRRKEGRKGGVGGGGLQLPPDTQ